MRDWLNNTGCTGHSFATSTDKTVTGFACAFMTQPGSNAVISNVISKTSTTTFKLGASSTISSGPGMLSGETAATSATLTFTKQ